MNNEIEESNIVFAPNMKQEHVLNKTLKEEIDSIFVFGVVIIVLKELDQPGGVWRSSVAMRNVLTPRDEFTHL